LQRSQVLDEVTNLPVIVALVDSADSKEAVQFRNLGIIDVLAKPVMFAQIWNITQKYGI
jgi:FixJ family two-component response regulator